MAVERGKVPLAPLFYLLGISRGEWNEERSAWEHPASRWFLSSQGVVPGGLLAVLADMAMSSIAGRHLRRRFSTSEMSMHFLRAATEQSKRLVAHGRFVSSTGRLALSEGTIADAAGRVVAHATCRNVVDNAVDNSVDGTAPPAAAAFDLDDPDAFDVLLAALPDVEPVETTPPHPYLREVVGEVLTRTTWEGATGREVLEGQIAGRIPMPPIHHLTGIRPVSVDTRAVEFAMPASGWLTSGFRTVMGGFIAFLGYSALASATQTTTEPGMAHVPVDLKVNFLRPVLPDPELRELTAVGRVVHRGRTLSVADAEVTGVDGKLVAIARGTSMFLPDQPADAHGRV